MWIITGPFDGEEAGKLDFQSKRFDLEYSSRSKLNTPEPKLLKTDRKYVLGRKQRHLVVNHKKVSHDHAEFTVGAFTRDDIVGLPVALPHAMSLQISLAIRKIPRSYPNLRCTIARQRLYG
jgi:hypothetical protein